MDKTILVKASSFSVAAQTYSDEDGEAPDTETAIYQILDDIFAEAENRLYRSSEDIHPATYNELARYRLLSTIQAIEALDNPRADMQGSIERLIAHPAIALLEPAAFALGDELGITGEDEPAAMPLLRHRYDAHRSLQKEPACSRVILGHVRQLARRLSQLRLRILSPL